MTTLAAIDAPLPRLSAASKTLIETGAGGQNKQRQAARTAAEEFEAVFLTTMLEGMFAGLKTKAPFGGGQAEKMYRSVLTGEYAKEMARGGGIGIADHVYRQLISLQESESQLR